MFELYKMHHFQVPAGAISESGIHAIEHFISSQDLQRPEWKALNPENGRSLLPTLSDDWRWDWLVSGKGDYVGTFPKRVSKFYFKQYGLKCPPEFIMQIGNLAKAHSESEDSYVFEFVDNFDWDAGDFGDRNSCYWGSYAGAKIMIRENGGIAIRFYNENNEGFARAWLVPIDNDLYILFNGYGLTTLNIARIFALFVGLQYKRINLENQEGGMYINGDVGYIIGAIEIIEEYDSYDFGWYEIHGDTCQNCGRGLDEDEVRFGSDDLTYCDDCFDRLFRYCHHCGETYDYDDTTYVESVGDDVCTWCLERHFAQCYRCEEYFRINQMEVFGEQVYCHQCSNELRIEGDNIE